MENEASMKDMMEKEVEKRKAEDNKEEIRIEFSPILGKDMIEYSANPDMMRLCTNFCANKLIKPKYSYEELINLPVKDFIKIMNKFNELFPPDFLEALGV